MSLAINEVDNLNDQLAWLKKQYNNLERSVRPLTGVFQMLSTKIFNTKKEYEDSEAGFNEALSTLIKDYEKHQSKIKWKENKESDWLTEKLETIISQLQRNEAAKRNLIDLLLAENSKLRAELIGIPTESFTVYEFKERPEKANQQLAFEDIHPLMLVALVEGDLTPTK